MPKIRFNIVSFIVILLVCVVLYFSWLKSPKIGVSILIPNWAVTWVDANENDTIRTAVPFVFLGLLFGIQLIQKKASLKWWLISLLFLTLLVFLAELGQLFLPLRSFDWKDISWGIIGSGIGLLIIYMIKEFIKIKKQDN